MEKTKSQLFTNFLLYYFAWWTIPYFAAINAPAMALAVFILCVLLQFGAVSNNKKDDLIETSIIFLTLSAFDMLMYRLDYFINLTDRMPYWLFLLNFIFATTFSYAFSVIKKYPLLQIFLAGVLAPVTYIRAADLGLIELYEPFMNYYIIHVVGWMIIIPMNFYIARLVKGITHDKESFGHFRSKSVG